MERDELAVSKTGPQHFQYPTTCCTAAHRGFVPRSRLMQCSKNDSLGAAAIYSITESASASSFGGISRPSALAVFRLMTSSNFAGC
jgi:hypothetical protein